MFDEPLVQHRPDRDRDARRLESSFGGHCCACSQFCGHIGGIKLCSQHRREELENIAARHGHILR